LQHRTDPTRQTIVSHHAKDLPPGTLKAILKQADLSPEEFLDLL
jgi:predicted RNA binding protein YcfA (HicA-like mRNA interferase family)